MNRKVQKPHFPKFFGWAVLLAIALPLASCEANNETLTEPQATLEETNPLEARSPDLAAVNEVSVQLSDYEITMPETLPAGSTTFVVSNIGQAPHNFEIEGQGIEEAFEDALPPDDTQTMQVLLQPGTYRVYCPVGDHAERGMVVELVVTEQ